MTTAEDPPISSIDRADRGSEGRRVGSSPMSIVAHSADSSGRARRSSRKATVAHSAA